MTEVGCLSKVKVHVRELTCQTSEVLLINLKMSNNEYKIFISKREIMAETGSSQAILLIDFLDKIRGGID